MCGITGVIRTKTATDENDIRVYFSDLLTAAYDNRHRGDVDGFGLVNVEKGTVLKSLVGISEIENEELDDTERKDLKKKTIKNLKIELERTKERKKEELNFAILHHRKASSGGVNLLNTHPIKINDHTYYVHNGTLIEHYVLKNYLTIFNKEEFKTELDSELLIKICENSLSKNKYTPDAYVNTQKLLTDLFYYYGVLLRIDTKNKEVMVIKDNYRDLYVYDYDSLLWLISEPIKDLKEFKSVHMLKKGTYKLSEKGCNVVGEGVMQDYTNKLLKAVSNGIAFKEIKCDFCKTEKQCLKIKTKGSYYYGDDKCLHCYLTGAKKDSKDNLDDEEIDDGIDDKITEIERGSTSMNDEDTIAITNMLNGNMVDEKETVKYNRSF